MYTYVEMITTVRLTHPLLHINRQFCVCLVRTLKMYSQQLSNTQCSIINYSHRVAQYIPKTFSFLYPLTIFTYFPYSPPPLFSVSTSFSLDSTC